MKSKHDNNEEQNQRQQQEIHTFGGRIATSPATGNANDDIELLVVGQQLANTVDHLGLLGGQRLAVGDEHIGIGLLILHQVDRTNPLFAANC